MPPDPPTTLCMLYIRGLVLRLLSDVLQATNARRPRNEASARTDNCVLRAPHQSPLYMYAPPFFNLWIRPCRVRVQRHCQAEDDFRRRQLPEKLTDVDTVPTSVSPSLLLPLTVQCLLLWQPQWLSNNFFFSNTTFNVII